MKKDHGLYWLLLAMVVFIIDIASKFWIINNFFLFESVNLLPFFSITYVRNIGAAFSIFEGQRTMLAILALVICAVIVHMLYRSTRQQKLENFSLSLILGGALGNLFDRLYHGFVIDFLDVNFGDWHYPTFNIADCAICVGIGLFILCSYKKPKKVAA
ncbi:MULTISPECIES: signal peptidase II [Gilliamella]|jgi:signal peptidase II|uniref:Lipoprotein signal peptidase n=1 Tax=Gilliamella intestini TaxID=1798183 RepID=A0A1C4C1R7_9GAMM|nr:MULTISPECIES: signal peptidase II [Gilliamella]MWP49161.1 lipoprotein signal peptidase [Gilliamella sp. Lep-s35]MWP68040.1 lipoprotein signal peptidase [Gilliamella sp. Lep-s5]MWP76260.1 lipoprotein signal peptidase [Gilliamella sp. Lep-s21]OCG45316.1 signal peptidase II [Gilliamella apicola]SCC13096.1 signal peptidase II [Gilliamella intestini]